MELRERYNDDEIRQTEAGDPSGGNLGNLRQEGERIYQAAADAISRALSHDSEAFLQQTRQEGGQ